MKHLLLLFIAFSLISCAKEDVYGPLKLTNGQEVELLVDHRYASDSDQLLYLPSKEPAGASLYSFVDRQPGYSYRVKARFHYEENPPQDGSSYWYDFVNVVSKEQYKGSDPFDVQLIVSYVVGGPIMRINKQGSNYFFSDKIQLTYAEDLVGKQLEEIWQNAAEVRQNWQLGQRPKWKAIKATVIHDPQKFGTAYLVKQIQFL